MRSIDEIILNQITFYNHISIDNTTKKTDGNKSSIILIDEFDVFVNKYYECKSNKENIESIECTIDDNKLNIKVIKKDKE